MASIGIGVTPTDKLTLGLDASLVLWNAYRTLDFAFSGNNGNAGPATDANTGLVGGKNTSTRPPTSCSCAWARLTTFLRSKTGT